MQPKLYFLTFFLFLAFTVVNAQDQIPSVNLKTLDGQTVDLKDYVGKGKPVFLSFWATWCKPCVQELNNISELLPEWEAAYQLEVVAVTIDTQRQLAKAKSTVMTNGWAVTILSDSNQQLMTKLGFQTIPQSFLLDGTGKVVYSHSGYKPGDEYELEEKLKSL